MKVVTATTDPVRAEPCLASWQVRPRDLIAVINGGDSGQPYLGTVRAFARGVDQALDMGDPIIACLHDDFRIDDADWSARVEAYFEAHPACGLVCFSGALGLGDADLYQKPYDPMSLARQGFRSNLDDAEAHGLRVTLPHQVVCGDGFSQIGRAAFFAGAPPGGGWMGAMPVYQQLVDLGIYHHFYDGALGCLAARLGWEVHYLPIRGHHFGGVTAVGDRGYQQWALQQIPEGDQGFWLQAHKIGYQVFSDVLPLRVPAAETPQDWRDDGEIFYEVPEG